MSEEASRGSVSLRIFARVRREVYAALGGHGSRAGRLLGEVSQRLGEVGERATDHRRWRTLRVPTLPTTDVSIVIAARSDALVVERCLRAIAAAGRPIAFETIVVDGAADPETSRLLAAVEGIRTIAGVPGESGVRAVNRGVRMTRGRHVVLLDGAVEPQLGWLQALIARVESASDVGVVAAKLLRSDGDLGEAGGIVWRDGGTTCFGDGQRRDAPEYDRVRAVDYGSATALLVRRELWEAIGGFDERFASERYAAADLCFAARDAGWNVLYEPRAVMARVSNAAVATPLHTGGESPLDQSKFVAKWGDALDRQPAHGEQGAYLASDRNRGPHVLIVDHRVPMPDYDAGSLRMLHIVRQLVAIGCRVTFMPDSAVADARYEHALEDLGVEVLDHDSDVAAYLAAAGDRTRLAILSRPYVASRYLHVVREHAPAARIAYDTVDLHYVRERRRAEVEGNANLAKSAGLRELELALARASDVTLVVSEDERQTLLAEEPSLEIAVLPSVNEPWSQVPPRTGRSGVLFVGGFGHDPNVGAALELAGSVMPAVWTELEDATLTVVGSNPPPELRALTGDRIDVRGWVDDLAPLLGGSVTMAAPLLYGAGVKGKITESLSAGLPVVTTAVGAEGLDVVPGRDILIGEGPEELARQIVELHRDPKLWGRLSANGRQVVTKTCSPEVQRPVLERLLAP
jgi:GT2 family glycosyltransferase/glycosyltransferase involved in cell wall biosynthesis